MSPKEYSNINKTNINKNPKGREKQISTETGFIKDMNVLEKERVRKNIRNSIYRNRLFEIFDNLYDKININELVQEGAYKACKEIIINRVNELSQYIDLDNVDPFEVAKEVKRKFPYNTLPETENNLRKFFCCKSL